ncbi:YrrS family protein [Bacillus subtilis]|uniref:YrrS family protein n=1 Tax=Bacillus subtilis TaxID=1423 RepID=UPI001D08208C|nr:YrrS family protein [Bacillus subtilis]MCB7159445.1 YrrS family protein [Bacillus subtilis]MCB7459557.1 YrrS family protein [Bacillus subtilis]
MSNNQSRYENRDKRRKANLVLNILIAIVSILIVVVAANLFINSPSSKDVSKDSETAQKQESPASGKTEKKSDEDIKDSKKDTSDSEKDSEKSSDSDSKKDDSPSKKDDSDSDSAGDGLKDAKVTEGGSSSDVEKTYENPDWKAVGTEQTGEHAATYDSSSQDWAEMLKAISYATGVSTDNMTVLWLGNNGSPQDAKGKILDKATGNKYQVTITWVDEKGWKPTKVEKLK